MSGLTFYYISVILAAIFAFIFQRKTLSKTKLKIIDYLPLVLSFACLFIPLGFRSYGTGVDDWTYRNTFESVRENGIFSELQKGVLEPGFLLIYQVISLFTGDFQVAIAVIAFLSLGFFYLGMLNERKSANYFLAFLLFGLMIYPYYFGILRLALTMSIAFYAIKFFLSGNRKIFNLFIILAASIHYSAIILLLLNFLPKDKLIDKKLRKYYIAILIAMPLLFMIVGKYIIPIAGERYLHYTNKTGNGVSLGDFDKLPIVVLCAMFVRGISKKNKNYQFYVFMYALALVVSISAAFIDFGRAQWYFNIYICFVLPILIQENYKIKQSKVLNYVLIPLIIIYGILYSTTIISEEANIVYFDKYENTLIDIGGNS